MKKLSVFLIIGLLIVLTGCNNGGGGVLTYPPAEVEFSEKNIALHIGESIALEYQAYPSNAVTSNVRLESSDTNVVKINGVVATGISEGTAAITAYYSSEILGQCVIKVSHVEPERIWLAENTIEGQVGRRIELSINTYPENATDTDYTFNIADETIAAFTEGSLWGVGIGTTDVTIVHNATGLSIDFVLSVTPVDAEKIIIIGKESVLISESFPLKVVFYPEDTTNQAIEWEVSDDELTTIKDSVFYAHKDGIVTIFATTESGITDDYVVEILPILPTEISLTCEDDNTLIIGDKTKLHATILPENTTDKTIEWKSSDESVASVNSKGTVKALKPGTVTITATLSNGLSDSYSFTINPKPVKISNGFIKKPKVSRIAPVIVHASKTESCYVYFKSAMGSKYDFSLFVKAGTTVEVKAPVGHYTMYYASGQTWYGVNYRFGVGTSYYKADTSFFFYNEFGIVYGTEITLYQVLDGNMSTYEINESEFPG